MILEEIKAIKSEKKDLKNFGLVMSIAFAILGGALWYKEKDTYSIFLAIADSSDSRMIIPAPSPGFSPFLL